MKYANSQESCFHLRCRFGVSQVLELTPYIYFAGSKCTSNPPLKCETFKDVSHMIDRKSSLLPLGLIHKSCPQNITHL